MPNEPTVAFRVPERCAAALDEIGSVLGLTRAELYKRLGMAAFFGLDFFDAHEALAEIAAELFPGAAVGFWNACCLVAETQTSVERQSGTRPEPMQALDTLRHWLSEGTDEERAEFRRAMQSRFIAPPQKQGRPSKKTAAKKQQRYARR